MALVVSGSAEYSWPGRGKERGKEAALPGGLGATGLD